MSKSAYEIWLSWQNGKEKFQLPVNPPSLDISNPSRNERVDLAKFGEITILQEPAAKTFSFSSFFPAHWSPLCEVRSTKMSLPWSYVKRMEAWKESKLPIRLVVTGTPINYAVSIEDFSLKEGDGDVGDIYFDLVLTEYVFVSPRKIDTKKKAPTKGNVARPSTKAKPKTHVVKKNETLWAIAKLVYNNSAEWKKIWNVNKDMLIKRDRRNIKQPGHWIYPGQKLNLP